ncbi:hypothetical protein Cni_G27441 [Canna indica]|uniref:Cation/H+ exchanger domain-containing protein n=1 Tax=Canna indica TaxID=4628 RepID=A0AAQ3QPB3_9LILI|nr:hypothetical protein Cni_G27441 [Canna indica]
MPILPSVRVVNSSGNDTICYDDSYLNSKGVFLGDDPFKFAVPLVLFDVALMFLVANATHYALKHLGQSRFVAELLAGIILGPSVIGKSLAFHRTFFPRWIHPVLDTLSLLGLVFFMFTVGVKTNLSLLRKPGRRSLAIGAASTFLPLVLSLALYFLLKPSFPNNLRDGPLVYITAGRLSLSSFAVVAAALDELQLLNSELGRIAMSASLVSDVSYWTVSTLVNSGLKVTEAKTAVEAIGTVASIVLILLFLMLVARPLVLWSVKHTPAGEPMVEWHFMVLVLTSLMMSFTTQALGYNVIIGPLILGLTIPGGVPVGQTLTEKLEPVCMGLLLPMYLTLAGYRTNLNELKNLMQWGVLELMVVVCFLSKLIGAVVMSRYLDMSMNDALSLGLMLNIRGVVEVFIFNTLGSGQLATTEHFSVLIISILVITATATPLIKLLYNPKMHYVARKRRTVEHTRHKSTTHFMACVHNEDHVAPLLNILEITHGSPISLTLLHLIELTGHSAAMFHPYKQSINCNAPTASDRIVNAFRYFEKKQSTTEPGAITLHPYVATSPYSTLYNDVCYLALDRKICLILLPFHKSSDGAQHTVNHSFQSLNRDVLAYAPCSVAILVDRSLATATCARTNHLLHRIAIYFLGGPDDREALAFASLMANNRSIALAIVRFLYRRCEDNDEDKERKQDDAAMDRVRQQHSDNGNVYFIEKLVDDGEGMAGVIREMSENFDLLIVGRRKGVDSKLTNGLSEWSEFPELGIVGDMLAVAEFTEKMSILVVQQQNTYKGGGRDSIDHDDEVLNHVANAAETDRPARETGI